MASPAAAARLTREEVEECVKAAFPGRSAQVSQLLGCLGGPFDVPSPLLLWGPRGTGKSSVLKGLLELLQRPYAWVSLTSAAAGGSQREILEDILSQLEGSSGKGEALRCESLNKFLELLPAAAAAKAAGAAEATASESKEAAARMMLMTTGASLPTAAAAWNAAAEEQQQLQHQRGVEVEEEMQHEQPRQQQQRRQQQLQEEEEEEEEEEDKEEKQEKQQQGHSPMRRRPLKRKQLAFGAPPHTDGLVNVQNVDNVVDLEGMEDVVEIVASPAAAGRDEGELPHSRLTRSQAKKQKKGEEREDVGAGRASNWRADGGGEGEGEAVEDGGGDSPRHGVRPRSAFSPSWVRRLAFSGGPELPSKDPKFVSLASKLSHPHTSLEPTRASSAQRRLDFDCEGEEEKGGNDLRPPAMPAAPATPAARPAVALPTVYLVIDHADVAFRCDSTRGMGSGSSCSNAGQSAALLQALLRLPELTSAAAATSAATRLQQHLGLQQQQQPDDVVTTPNGPAPAAATTAASAAAAPAPAVGVILVTRLSWAAMRRAMACCADPTAVVFPAYSEGELLTILSRRRPHSALYRSFLRQVGRLFARVHRSLPELAASLEPVWQAYRRPVLDGAVSEDDPNAGAKLFARVSDAVRVRLRDPVACIVERESSSSSSPCAVEMPMLGKFVLLAAYVCSRNPPTLDDTLFEASRAADRALVSRRKNKCRNASGQKERREREARELQLLGPSAFPLRRWLAVSSAIIEADGSHLLVPPTHSSPSPSSLTMGGYAAQGSCSFPYARSKGMGRTCEEEEDEEGEDQGGVRRQSALWSEDDLLVQMATLVRARLVSSSRDDPLDLGAKYWCQADRQTVVQVAKAINFPLHRYLLYG